MDAPGLALSVQGVALASGAIGERVTVMNPVSHAELEAEVTGPDRVRVAPGALPAVAPRDQAAAHLAVR
jgi:flagella basal body P-ring formation protein FlgA